MLALPRKRHAVMFLFLASLVLLALFPPYLAASTLIVKRALTLAWDPNTEPDLAGYTIYYGTQSGIYDFTIDVGNVTQYTVTGLEPATQYYFSVTARDSSGNESDFSAELPAATDPMNLIISGLGETSGGWMEEFTGDYSHANWLRVGWTNYNSANGEARLATGDIDGDGRYEIVIGLGPVSGDPSIPGGWFEVLDDDYTHLAWGRIHWTDYNSANGESWPALGDVDGDGKDEIIVGLGPGGNGWFEVFDYEAGSLVHKTWRRVNWKTYYTQNAETRPACGDIDGDGLDEIVIGLGQGAGGYLEVFDDASAGFVHLDWVIVHWGDYCSTNGETWPACGDVDGDGKDEIIVGLGPGGNGWFEIVDDNYTNLAWGRINWSAYSNSANAETRPACGDIDGDGRDEIVIGLSQGGEGWMEVFDDASAGFVHLAWPRVQWGTYNSANGETWPAVRGSILVHWGN
jgi:hypothetical protein